MSDQIITTNQIMDLLLTMQANMFSIQENMATKNELAELRGATKNDIHELSERMATHEEFEFLMEHVANKEDLKPFATKMDLLNMTDRFDAKLTDLKKDILELVKAATRKPSLSW